MKKPHLLVHQRSDRGSTLMVVMCLFIILGIVTASIISVGLSELRLNERQRLVISTRNTAENILNYAAAQLPTKLYRLRSISPIQFSAGSNQIYTPPTGTIMSTEWGNPTVAVHAGLTTTNPLTYIDPTVASNSTNTYRGLSIITGTVPVVAQATLSSPILGTFTDYLEQDLTVAQIPLFQFLIFYNMNLEFGPGADMILTGPVHANGDIIARDQDGHTNTLQFSDRVSASGGLYANVVRLGNIYNNDGSANNSPGGTGPLNFTTIAGAQVNLRTSTNLFRDYSWSTNGTGTATPTTITTFLNWANSTFGSNLQMVAPRLIVAGAASDLSASTANRKNIARSIVEPPDNVNDTPQLYQNKFSRHAGLYIIVNPTDSNPARADNCRAGILPDGNTILLPPNTYLCWLNTLQSDGVTHTLNQVVLPGQPSYLDPTTGAIIKNNLPNRFTNLTAIGSNQVIRIPIPAGTINDPIVTVPGTATNVTPSAVTNAITDAAQAWPVRVGYTMTTATLLSMTSFTDGYFYELRRATNSNGYPGSRAAATPYKPRPIAKIDFDMTRFRLMVERTVNGAITSSAIYNPDVPQAANWTNNILNPSATPRTYGLAIRTGASPYSYITFPIDSGGTISSDPFRIYMATAAGATPDPANAANLINTATSSTPWYDGIAVYIHSVDAEDRSNNAAGNRNRIDSGVRYWNGRGPVISLPYTGKTGCSIATNDAVYIVGHFNSNGGINNNPLSTGFGGYSAQFPEAANEKLCCIMGDSMTILSQPVYSRNSNGFYVQTSGWSDSFSPNSFSSGSWSANWQTTNPSSGNQYEGITDLRYAGRMPNEGSWNSTPIYNTTTFTGATFSDTSSRIKLYASNTEVSACMLVGIVRTTSPAYPRGTEPDGVTPQYYEPSGYQNSGGAHNFPRMTEDWTSGGATMCLRTSMVAMFECEVSCEPWPGTRVYSAPTRLWGLHDNLRAANASTGSHDVPLEPMLIGVSRLHFAEINRATFEAQRSAISGLPN